MIRIAPLIVALAFAAPAFSKDDQGQGQAARTKKPGQNAPAPHGASKQATQLKSVDGKPCTGLVMSPPRGMREVQDPALQRQSQDATGKGKLCIAKVFEAVSPVTVYRVWNSTKAYTEFGSWWSFSVPKGPEAAYRDANAICPEWSDLDRLSVCKIKVGARVAVGPGQSADCATVKYAKNRTNQVFIPNDGRANKIYVTDCKKLGNWPQAPRAPKKQAAQQD